MCLIFVCLRYVCYFKCYTIKLIDYASTDISVSESNICVVQALI